MSVSCSDLAKSSGNADIDCRWQCCTCVLLMQNDVRGFNGNASLPLYVLFSNAHFMPIVILAASHTPTPYKASHHMCI